MIWDRANADKYSVCTVLCVVENENGVSGEKGKIRKSEKNGKILKNCI